MNFKKKVEIIYSPPLYFYKMPKGQNCVCDDVKSYASDEPDDYSDDGQDPVDDFLDIEENP